jgi:Mycoplasma protein of unknown function, DUF285
LGNAKKFNSDISKWDMSSLKEGRRIFDGAAIFNYSMCAWGETMPKNADVSGMFNWTSCPTLENPILNISVPGPFCHVCE